MCRGMRDAVDADVVLEIHMLDNDIILAQKKKNG